MKDDCICPLCGFEIEELEGYICDECEYHEEIQRRAEEDDEGD